MLPTHNRKQDISTILFDHYDIPFWVNAAIMMSLVWLYTRRGGVKSVVWVEMLKTLIMVGSLVAAIVAVVMVCVTMTAMV